MKKRIAVLLVLALLLPVAAGALPVDENPTGFFVQLWERLVELVVGHDETPPAAGDDALGPMADPNGIAATTELPPPGGELGPMTDPNG
jgi:hypothetical protein